MKLKQKYHLTPTITELLIEIEANKKALSLVPIDPHHAEVVRAKSLLKSGLYSARIEGNPLSFEEYPYSPDKLKKLEVSNLHRTLEWAYQTQKPLTLDLVKKVHSQAMNNLRSDAGSFRAETSAIFDSSGNAVYLTPPPEEIVPSLSAIINLFYESQDHVLVRIAMFHYQFEKLHPFLDGNGRVGRVITNLLLYTNSYSLMGSVSLDEEIENTRSDYYHHLQNEENDLTDLITYFLECLNNAQNKALKHLTNNPGPATDHNLTPRRAEILNIIKDHSPCSFDQIKRRFLSVNPRTLHYDLQEIKKLGLIKKLGSTRGALYSAT